MNSTGIQFSVSFPDETHETITVTLPDGTSRDFTIDLTRGGEFQRRTPEDRAVIEAAFSMVRRWSNPDEIWETLDFEADQREFLISVIDHPDYEEE